MYNYDPSDAALPTLIRAPNFKSTLHGLIHPESNRLMVLSSYRDTVSHLSQTAGTYVLSINKSTFGRGPLMKNFFGWTWEWEFKQDTRTFQHSPAPQDYELHYWMRINAEKAAVLDTIYSWVNSNRQNLSTDIVYQRDVRERKVKEAEQLLAGVTGEFPYLTQYSNETGIPISEVASRVLMNGRDIETVLLETERIRIKYGKALRDATNIASVRALHFDFQAEKGDPSQTLIF